MKKIYVTLLLTMSLVIGVNAQSEKEQKIKYVYTSTTSEALEELNSLSKGDRLIKDEAIKLMNKYEKSGVIFLSSLQYQIIKERIDAVANNEEDEQYAKEASEKYMSITDLLK